MRTYHSCTRFLTGLVSLIALSRCGSEPKTAPLAYELAVLTISEGLNYEYGYVPVGQIVEHTFTVTNVGEEMASGMQSAFHITAFQYWGGTYPGVGGTCGTELQPEESCTIVISFGPIHASIYTSPIQIVYHNGLEEVITSRPVLRGTAVGP